MKKLFFAGIAMSVMAVLVAGVFLWAELAYRVIGFTPNRGALIDATLFPYAQYLVSTHPPSTRLGLGQSILDGYYGTGDECVADDGAAARFNSLGFRGPEFPPRGSKGPNEVRVLISGGSASISWNIGEKCTLDALLEKRLQKALPGKTVRIFNVGNGAWKSFQELVAMQLHGLDLQPDVVVHFSGFNDAFHAYSMEINRAYSKGMIDLAFQRYVNWLNGTPGEFLSNFRIGFALKSLLAEKAQVFDRPAPLAADSPERAVAPEPGKLGTAVHLPLDLEAIVQRDDFDPYNRDVVDNYLKNESLMARALSTVNARLISALQPTLYLKKPMAESEDRMMHSGYAETVNFTVQAYLRLRQGLAKLNAQEPNQSFIDLSTAFNGSDAPNLATTSISTRPAM